MPASPVTDRLVECMSKAGWKVTRSWTGGVDGPEVPSEQVSAYQAASKRCEAESGWDRINNLTPGQIDEMFQQESDQHTCLTKLGIESDQPPSLQKYRDSFGTEAQYFAMMPGFMHLSQGEMRNATRDCPPPVWFMNISGL